MGSAKRLLELFENRGFGDTENKSVCLSYFERPDLRKRLAGAATNGSCSYCGMTGNIVQIEDVLEVLVDTIRFAYDEAVDALPYDGSEGGYQGSDTYDTYDVLSDHFMIQFGEPFNDLGHAIYGGPWCAKNPFSIPVEVELATAWDQFVEITKHESRYFFSSYQKPPGDALAVDLIPSPREFLDAVATTVSKLKLIRRLCTTEDIYRVRLGETCFHGAADLGSVPVANAKQANRMSPAGIPMFYGATDPQVALAEVPRSAETVTSTGRFRLRNTCLLVDLAKIPDIPSVFELDHRQHIGVITFLRDFADQIARPVSRGAVDHIEYTPTQVLTEFFRYRFTFEGQGVDGIVYRSAAFPDGESIVLFFRNEECGDANSVMPQHKLLLQDAHHTHHP